MFPRLSNFAIYVVVTISMVNVLSLRRCSRMSTTWETDSITGKVILTKAILAKLGRTTSVLDKIKVILLGK